MSDSRVSTPSILAAWTALLLLGLAVRLPNLDAPLLEGAAGKQAHTAMVARNLYRDRATWDRPRVDDVGKPGYFVKELPLVPASAAAIYGMLGRVDERVGRLLAIGAWLAAIPAVLGLLWRPAGAGVAIVAGLWFVLAPMGIAYSRAFMNDPAAVSASLFALWSLLSWRERPSAARAWLFGGLTALTLLLKPHAVFWLAPGAAVLLAPRRGEAGASSSAARSHVWLVVASVVAIAIAGAWYLHAARIHRSFPVQGATVLQGWIDPSLLARPALYAEIFRQDWNMVFTPAGGVLAVIALLLVRGRLERIELALLAWGGGVLLQCLVFSTRMFDVHSRGTEYYQLAMVPVAGALIGRGLAEIAARAAPLQRTAPWVVYAAGVALLAAGAFAPAREAMKVPHRYAKLLEDCAQVQRQTAPGDELVVLADRGGTVLYYCDRRGTVFQVASAESADSSTAVEVGFADRARAFATARYVLIPFPELLPEDTGLRRFLEEEWRRVPLPARSLLYARAERAS